MRVLFSYLALLFLCGCSAQFDQLNRSIDSNSHTLESIETQHQLIQTEVATIASIVSGLQNSDESTQQRLLARLGQINTKIDQLAMQLDDNSEYMRTLSARVDLLTTRLGVATVGEYKETPDSNNDITILPEEGKSIFQTAMSYRDQGHYDLAQEGFMEFLTKYPKSELADDAFYKLGDIAGIQGDVETAMSKYIQLIEQYPSSELVADSYLSLISLLVDNGKRDLAENYYIQLENNFPGAEQTKLAQSILQSE